MADVTPILINQLTSQTTLQDTDYFIVGGDDAKKITVAQMKEALGINSLNTKIKYVTYRLSGTESAAANTWNYISDVGYRAPEGYKIVSVCGSGQAWPYASVNPVVMSSGAIFVWYYKANTNSNNLNNIVLYITLEKTD